MLKIVLIALLGIVVLQDASAQKRDTLIYYFKNDGQATDKSSADFSLFIMPARNSVYPVAEYYKDGKTKLTATSQVQSIDLVLQGPATSYYSNGITSRNANYKDGKPDGEMTDYYPNGNKSKIVNYKDGVLTETVIDYYPNGKLYAVRKFNYSGKLEYVECRDSTGAILAEKGNGKWLEFDEDFKIVTKQNPIKNGVLIDQLLIGVSRYSNDVSRYSKYNKDNVAQAIIVAGSPNTITDEEYNKTGDVLLLEDADKQPEFPAGKEAFAHFLGSTVHYPEADREKGISGRVFVRFIVEKDGHLSNIQALRGPSETLKTEAARTVSLSPKWTPGLKNGVVTRVAYITTISFALGEEDKLPNGIFLIVDKQPEFPGGLESFGSFLSKNIIFPVAGRTNGTSGRVLIQFIVEKDGSLSDIKARSGPSETTKYEAVRVMKYSPKWIPGMQNNNPVRVQCILPINFTFGN